MPIIGPGVIINVELPHLQFTEDPKSALPDIRYSRLTTEAYHHTRYRLEQWYDWAKAQKNHPWFTPPMKEEPHYWFIEFHDGHGEIKLHRPIYQHDCLECRFLGNYEDERDNHAYDLYSCTKGPMPTLIARYGNDGHEYRSGALFVGVDPAITEAERRRRNDARDFIFR